MIKIDSTTSHESAATQRLDPHRETGPAKSPLTPRSGADQIQLSPDSALLAEAFRRLDSEPEIRHDLVAQVQEDLARGNLGQDVERLADTIINRLLES